MSSLEIVTLTKDIVLMIAAIAAAHAAINGLKTWNHELKGKADFEVARSLARATYKLRDEVRGCRSDWYHPSEFPKEYDTFGKDPIEKAKAYHYLYQQRWKYVSDALQTFEVQAVEAEALWGSSSKIKTDEFRQCVRNLQVSIDAYVSDIASSGEDFGSDKEFAKSVKADIWARKEDENELSIKIDNAVKEIELYVQPHFRRS